MRFIITSGARNVSRYVFLPLLRDCSFMSTIVSILMDHKSAPGRRRSQSGLMGLPTSRVSVRIDRMPPDITSHCSCPKNAQVWKEY